MNLTDTANLLDDLYHDLNRMVDEIQVTDRLVRETLEDLEIKLRAAVYVSGLTISGTPKQIRDHTDLMRQSALQIAVLKKCIARFDK